MSKSKQRGKRFKEWWGKRPLSYHPVSNNSKTDKFFKRLLHKMERVQGKKEIEMKDAEKPYNELCSKCDSYPGCSRETCNCNCHGY